VRVGGGAAEGPAVFAHCQLLQLAGLVPVK